MRSVRVLSFHPYILLSVNLRNDSSVRAVGLQVPLPRYRAAPESPAAAMLFTGEDKSTATALAGNLFVQQTLTAADLSGPVATFQSQAAQVSDHTLPIRCCQFC